ncbi:MAG: GIY-YIG nuclease family protein [Chloroflexi bacterium AL-N10]|nr:GIY-YIG nuclease family protein [Chloroflexi bacterium AL-N1]NOK69584.1 GIY-YIG nuclease family protein [Chloroflexi bacterium AL-N10]NOK72131.1 GIY-YIG nuclease family protein [Chloroflexi bacterium AL-N5]
MKGTYLLVLRLDTDLHDLPIGRLGSFHFVRGYYLYVGSAFGAGGLAARLAYHRQRVKVHPHWHIDYVRPYAEMIETWAVYCAVRLEQLWVESLSAFPEVTFPVRKFGASDSTCYSHLLYTSQRPDTDVPTAALLDCLAMCKAPLPDLTLDICTYDDSKQ